MNVSMIEFDIFVARRSDPNKYGQLSGYIDKRLLSRLKLACTALDIRQTEAMEEAVRLWLEKYEPNYEAMKTSRQQIDEDEV